MNCIKMKTIYLFLLCLCSTLLTQAKHKEKRIRYESKINQFIYPEQIKHTNKYTIFTCIYDDKSPIQSRRKKYNIGTSSTKIEDNITIDKTIFLEDYHLKNNYPLIKVKGIKEGKVLTGRKKIKFYFPPLEGQVRDGNICQNNNKTIITGLTIDRRADLRYRPSPIETGTVKYCELEGTYIKNPKYEGDLYDKQNSDLQIDKIEFFDDEIVFTINYKKNNKLCKDANFWQTFRYLTDEGFDSLIDEVIDELVFKEHYTASPFQIGMNTYLYNQDEQKKIQLKKIEGIDYDELLLIKKGKAGDFKLVFDFDGNTSSKYDLKMISKNNHYNFSNIELKVR